MALDPKYVPNTTVGTKIIIRKDDKTLITREPEDHTWMPGRLGLPGGKLTLNEGIVECALRKINEETGLVCKLTGLVKIINILMPDRNVYFYILTADYLEGDFEDKELYTAGLKWMSKEEILRLSKDDFAEYYYDDIFKEYFANEGRSNPLDVIKLQKNFMDSEIQAWMEKGTIRE